MRALYTHCTGMRLRFVISKYVQPIVYNVNSETRGELQRIEATSSAAKFVTM